MKISKLHIPTLREAPKDAEVISHQYLVRAGFVRRVAAGIYSFLPLGVRSLEKIKAIVRQEMNEAGAQEVFMPAVIPAELWEESGRWTFYGPELLRMQDRKQGHFCLGPTHEEVVVDLVRKDVRSYKQLPINLYQIQTKFRDEMRPRAGLMRGREFVMKDAYSFDSSVENAHKSYHAMYEAYGKIFKRFGLDFRAVEADTGNIGGSMSHEFQVLADSGEDAIVSCDRCDFAANVEKAPLPVPDFASIPVGLPSFAAIETPGAKSIEQVCLQLKCQPADMIKAVLYMADDQAAVAFVRGDREVNEIKIKKLLGCKNLFLADAGWFAKETGLPPGYLGPIVANDAKGKVKFLLDHEIRGMATAVCGANVKQQHLQNVSPQRDLQDLTFGDLRMAVAGDPCPRCEGKLRGFKGIEVGHVFYLGQKYSQSMQATFLDEQGQAQPFEMGCYGIGVSRILSAAIEQNHDSRGIRWPVAIAPFEVIVLPMNADGPAFDLAVALYKDLKKLGIDAALDDRDERPGIKFADADLIGYPLQVVAGKRAADGIVEVKIRHNGSKSEMSVADLLKILPQALATARLGRPLVLA